MSVKGEKKEEIWLSIDGCHLEQRLIFSIVSTLLRSNPDIDPQSLYLNKKKKITQTYYEILKHV